MSNCWLNSYGKFGGATRRRFFAICENPEGRITAPSAVRGLRALHTKAKSRWCPRLGGAVPPLVVAAFNLVLYLNARTSERERRNESRGFLENCEKPGSVVHLESVFIWSHMPDWQLVVVVRLDLAPVPKPLLCMRPIPTHVSGYKGPWREACESGRRTTLRTVAFSYILGTAAGQ